MREVVYTVVIKAPPAAVLDAFFDAASLAAWWGVTRAICVPRALGAYAVEWAPASRREESPGRLDGTLHGTVMEFKPGEEFFVADLYWHPSDDDHIGPMALEATCRSDGAVTHLHLRQSGHDTNSPRWSRYYDAMTARWEPALQSLKQYLEDRWRD
jgi:uncharacterized protein YndB with AHSA1/START domain